MHGRKLALAVAFTTALLAGSTQLAHARTAATTNWVSPNTVGTNTSCSNPGFNSIQAAVNASVSGDTVIVCAGTYNESVSVTTDNLTLLGAKNGLDARPNRGLGESIVNPPSGQVGISLAANNLTLDGFQVSFTGGNSGVYTSPSYSGYTVVNNIIDHNMFGLYLNTGSATSNLVEHNRFVENNLSGPASGNGIYSDQGLQNVNIHANKFLSNDNAAILIGYAGAPTSGITIANNTSNNDGNFAGVFSGTNVTINNNHATNDTSTAIRLEGVDGVLVKSNTIKNPGYSGIAVRDSGYGQPPTDNVTVSRNKVTGAANDGLDVTATTDGVVTMDHNTINGSANDGIEMASGTLNNHLVANKAFTSSVKDCRDASSGSHTAGTANFWFSNHGTTSLPVGLCTP